MSHDHSGHSHDHDDHGHTHAHAPASFGKAFAIGIALNLGFVIIEALYGLMSNSVSLLADAGHNLSDVLGLGIAWLGSVLAQRAPTARFTYGLRGSSILAALFNAVFLLVTVGGLSWEAIRRLGTPEPVAGKTMMAVAAVGIVVNALTAWLFASGSKEDINLRGAFLHMASDALVSVGVVVAGVAVADASVVSCASARPLMPVTREMAETANRSFFKGFLREKLGKASLRTAASGPLPSRVRAVCPGAVLG